MAEQKCICESCNWQGMASELLTAKNPFDPTEPIEGCPACFAINETAVACDEPECWRRATCGFPVECGYRQTCYDHSDFKRASGEASNG